MFPQKNHLTCYRILLGDVKMKWSKIGEIGVDSGKFIICDPCYLNNKGDLKIIQNHDSDSLL